MRGLETWVRVRERKASKFKKHFKGRKSRIGNGLDKEDERRGRVKDNFKVSSL